MSLVVQLLVLYEAGNFYENVLSSCMCLYPYISAMYWFILIFLSFTNSAKSSEWDATNFPNPTAGQFKECNMRTTASICDPDGVLSESARYRLDHDLKQLESRTRQDRARTFCDKKGVTAAMAVARHVKGGSTDAVKRMANDMLQRWTLDPQCQKAVVIVVSTDDAKFWVARDDKVPIYAQEFTEIFVQQKSLFQQKNYQQALTNILQATWEKALDKQGTPSNSGGGRGTGTGGGGTGGFGGGGTQGGGGQGPVGGGGKGSGQGFKMPSISKWVVLFIVCVVIPLLLCCCCIYCCCCKGKGGAARQPLPQDGGGGQMGGGGGGGRSGGGMGNFLSTLGGSGIGSMLGGLLSRGGRGGGGGGGGMPMGASGGGYGMGGDSGYQGGGAYPSGPQPVYDDNKGEGGKGLYPSKAIKDEGGGGSWA